MGCARSLSEAERQPYPGDEDKELVTCSCRRVFVYDKRLNTYRRAEFDEVRK